MIHVIRESQYSVKTLYGLIKSKTNCFIFDRNLLELKDVFLSK